MADSLIRRFFRSIPVQVGLATLLLSWLIYFSFGEQKPAFISGIDARIVDAMFRLRGPEQTTGKVVIVDIDERSLHKFGQWPWPRDIVARLTQKIYDAAPLAIGFDILFAEPDQTSPTIIIERYPELFNDNSDPTIPTRAEKADHDRIFAETLKKGPGILGYVVQFSNDGLKQQSDLPWQNLKLTFVPQPATSGNLPFAPPYRAFNAYRAIGNIKQLAQSSRSEGFINIFPDASGTVRRAPLFLSLDNLPLPSLPFEMVRTGENVETVTIDLEPSADRNSPAVSAVELGSHLYRTDGSGNLTINFRGPATTFITISAMDVLAGTEHFLLQQKYVLLGSTAVGIMDAAATPFSQQTPGVEIHANVIDNLLAGDYLIWENFTERSLTYTITGVFGLLLTFSLAFLSPAAGIISGAGLLIMVAAGNYFLLFLKLKLIGLSYTLLSLVVIFLLVTFANYFTEGRRRQFVRRAFSRYVSPEVVNKLLNNQGDFAMQVESREVTVLFSDIRDFTRQTENMSPTHLGEFLNCYLSRMTSLIIKYNGMVDKFVGDGIMAVWGTPLNDDHHPQNAVTAALSMISELQKKDTTLKIDQTPLEVGIGINSGPVSAGNFGSNKRFTYTVLGDTVNLASRIEGLTKIYGLPLLLSDATVAGLHATIPCQRIDTVLVKGRYQPVSIFIPEDLFFNEGENELEKQTFNSALSHYENREFEAAQQLFTTLQDRWPKRTYFIYRQRCQDFVRCPPPVTWDGVWDFN